MDKERVRQIACSAVEKLAEDRGLDATFPFDAIWRYAAEDVPSLKRPTPQRYLVAEGYLEATGEQTNAESGARAGSPTTAYRLGRRFRTAPNDAVATDATLLDRSIADLIRNLEGAMLAKGYVSKAAELANFFLALAASPLVILAGISGTGKSRLPSLFADLINAKLKFISVKPQWSDNSDLFGYTPSLNPTQFIYGDFTKVVAEASTSTNSLFIVHLDEMNLAAVEHYFSDFLSVVESRQKVAGRVITNALPLDLPPIELLSSEGTDSYSHLRNLHLPSNIRVVGTANMDETTHTFSPKVLDRAFSIEFDDPDLTDFALATEEAYNTDGFNELVYYLLDPENPISVNEAYPSSDTLFDGIGALLQEVKDILKPAGITFGYRSRNDICLYMYFWQKFQLAGVLTPAAAMDFCFRQKILPKISGSGESLRQSLDNLLEWLGTDETGGSTTAASVAPWESRPWKRSIEKVQNMIDRLEVDGATTYWGS